MIASKFDPDQGDLDIDAQLTSLVNSYARGWLNAGVTSKPTLKTCLYLRICFPLILLNWVLSNRANFVNWLSWPYVYFNSVLLDLNSFRKEEDVVGEIKTECETKAWLSRIFSWRLSTFEIKRFEHFAPSASSSWLLFSWRESLLIIKMNFPKKGSGQL